MASPLPQQGLSPRVRGNPPDSLSDGILRRSIPASAGEPALRPHGEPQLRVYPRECGGTSWSFAPPVENTGLSPRVRGNHARFRDHGAEPRSIPASAGEPAPARRGCLITWVYPRECGGTDTSPPLQRAGRGLSPRVRGNPSNRCPIRTCRRSIPASAGEPIPT